VVREFEDHLEATDDDTLANPDLF